MQYAANKGHVEELKLLLEAGANVDVADEVSYQFQYKIQC